MKEIKVDINGIEHTIQVDEDDPRAIGKTIGTDDPKKSVTPANKAAKPADKK